MKYIASKVGGLDKLKGKKIGLIYLDAPFGKEPLPLLELLAKENGFELTRYPVPGDKMQDQSSQWLKHPVGQPGLDDHVGFGGAMNPTAVKESRQGRLPDGQVHRRVVVGLRRRCARRRGRGPRAT